ncbi:MAG: hypothetical protein AAF485_23745 [Chloroflexota bacterium]
MMDYVQAAAIYINQADLLQRQNQIIVNELWAVAAEQSMPDISVRALKYLLARVLLGPVQGGDVNPTLTELTRSLKALEYFCETDM